MDATPPDPPPTPEPNPYEAPHTPIGKPRKPRLKPMSVLAAGGGVVLIVLSCLIGFLATCFPIGLVAFSEAERSILWNYLPFIGGVLGGIVAGWVAYRLTFRSRRRIMASLPPDEGPPR